MLAVQAEGCKSLGLWPLAFAIYLDYAEMTVGIHTYT
jgi:hypothetical protein